MTGGALPAAMAIAALALMLGFVGRRAIAVALALAAVVALAASRVALPEASRELVFLGCWAGVAVVAATVYLPTPPVRPVALALAALAGAAAGLVIAVAGVPGDLPRASLAGLLVLPASICVARGYRVVPRVVASWLIAVALLAAVLPYAVAHPGYVPDHRG